MNNTSPQPEVTRLRRKVAGYKALAFVLAVLLVSALTYEIATRVQAWRQDNAQNLDVVTSEENAPHSEEIKKIISPLRYSGISIFLRPEVTLSLDFAQRQWTLHNIHQYDAQGNIVLVNNRQGICGDLSAYTYDKIKDLLGQDYTIEFVYAAQSGYFLISRSSHIVLRLTPKRKSNRSPVYIIDPSFHRYGRLDEFEDYDFFDAYRQLPLFAQKQTDESFAVDTAFPLLIRKNTLVSLTVKAVNNAFDKDNFLIALSGTKRNNFAGRPIIIFYKANGQKQIFNYDYVTHVLTDDEYTALTTKLADIFSAL